MTPTSDTAALPRPITTTEDVEAWRDVIAEHAADGWDWDQDTGKVDDWDAWLSRFEALHDVDLPASYDDPVVRKVQRIAREAIRQQVAG